VLENRYKIDINSFLVKQVYKMGVLKRKKSNFAHLLITFIEMVSYDKKRSCIFIF
jgi:hypothetical protein